MVAPFCVVPYADGGRACAGAPLSRAGRAGRRPLRLLPLHPSVQRRRDTPNLGKTAAGSQRDRIFFGAARSHR
ncbi:MAG: hypothetical protein BWY94_01975 [Actinobacteria bacterium ADurb.BinA094]|nr:MAG: hypothetical protein BWY94_01975 [Actinobacteria bacterium ADurb.BinA094]